ncbi:MAG: hypothetical protein K6E39_03350 [Lachnospiraceae bacterium]|nr:hypothetical protein [Lachnospiraceae bacterium]
MDRYEHKLKMNEMRTALEEGRVEDACLIADSINYRKEKTVSMLCLIGEVYEKAERYEESKDALLCAYERSPIGRTILYRLAIVAVKSGNPEEAEEFYNEFVNIAPTDNLRYILKYQILKAKGASIAEMISVLEEYKERESSERWSYELATLYHKAGMTGKCVELCDEIVLWYGEGKYVEKALELKMTYQPLTPEQEKKYRKIRQKERGVVEVFPGEVLRSGDIITEKREIPEVTYNPEIYNTINLQQEIANNMQRIMEATAKDEVNNAKEKIKELVNTIPYLNLPQEEIDAMNAEKYGHIETDEEIDGSLMVDFREMFEEEHGGQLSLSFENKPEAERQITGQMSIQDVLDEWEKTKQAAKRSMEVAEAKRLESAKARALQEAEGIMDRLNDMTQKLSEGKTPRDLMEEEYARKAEVSEEEGIEVELEEPEEEPRRGFIEVSEKRLDSLLESVMTKKIPDVTVEAEDAVQEEKPLSEEPVAQAEEDIKLKEEIEQKVAIEKTKEITLPEEIEEDIRKELGLEREAITHFNQEQKNIFSYFAKVDGMEKQICQAMDAVIHKKDLDTSLTGNIIIEGGRGSGKTMLALDLIKALKNENVVAGQKKVGKINADALNKTSIVDLFAKIHGGFLIIEKAGSMSKETLEGLTIAMEGPTDGTIIIMEDIRSGITKVINEAPLLANKFATKISIPVFTSDELVHFARSYGYENGYEMDEMAILALYNRISGIQKADRATYVTEVKAIMDDAMNKADRGSLFKKRRDDNGYIIIREKDFENK